MPTLEGRLSSVARYQSDEPVTLGFELLNTGDQDLYVLTWYTPLEGLNSDCLNVSRDGSKVSYDGPLIKRGTPTAEDYVLIPAGRAVSTVFELGRAYGVSTPGNYNVALDTEIGDFFPATSARSLAEALDETDRQNAEQSLLNAETWFIVVWGQGAQRLTKGQEARRWSRAKRQAEAADDVPQAGALVGAREPVIIGVNAARQAQLRQAHFDAYNLCLNALAVLANDARYWEWFGAHTEQRFQVVRNNFTRIKGGMESKTFTYIFPGEECDSETHAYTYKGQERIWVCTLFWSSSANSKAGTVLHEHSHASARIDLDTVDREACRRMARDEPDRTLRNAPSHEYYAE